MSEPRDKYGEILHEGDWVYTWSRGKIPSSNSYEIVAIEEAKVGTLSPYKIWFASAVDAWGCRFVSLAPPLEITVHPPIYCGVEELEDSLGSEPSVL